MGSIVVEDLIPIFLQMTGMVIGYTFELFWVPDLHPRSQEHPPKSRRGSRFLKVCLSNFSVFQCFGGFGGGEGLFLYQIS